MDKLRVFVSSRIHENERWREAIQGSIDSAGHLAVLYPERSDGQRRTRDFRKGLADSDVVVYLLSGPPTAWVQQELDDVFKSGKPLIALEHRDSNSGADFAEEHSLMLRKFASLDDLNSIVIAELEGIISRRFQRPRDLYYWGGDTYQRAIEFIRGANEKFALLQETSSLVLGPKRDWDDAEKRFLEAFYTLAEDTTAGKSKCEILHLFDREATAQALLREPSRYPNAAEWFSRLHQLQATNPRVRIAGVGSPLSPLMISDDSMLTTQFFGKNEKRATLHSEVGEWSRQSWDAAESAFREGAALTNDDPSGNGITEGA